MRVLAPPRPLVGLLLWILLAPLPLGAGFREAPEFPTRDPAHWLGAPVRMADLRGKVVLLDVWTFG
jgi:hypothetical protein